MRPDTSFQLPGLLRRRTLDAGVNKPTASRAARKDRGRQSIGDAFAKAVELYSSNRNVDSNMSLQYHHVSVRSAPHSCPAVLNCRLD